MRVRPYVFFLSQVLQLWTSCEHVFTAKLQRLCMCTYYSPYGFSALTRSAHFLIGYEGIRSLRAAPAVINGNCSLQHLRVTASSTQLLQQFIFIGSCGSHSSSWSSSFHPRARMVVGSCPSAGELSCRSRGICCCSGRWWPSSTTSVRVAALQWLPQFVPFTAGLFLTTTPARCYRLSTLIESH